MAEAVPTKEALEARFDFLAGKVTAPKPRRLWVEPPADRFREVLEHLVRELGCDQLCTITGLDDKETLVAVYHLNGAHGVVVNLKRRVPKAQPVISSVTDLFPGGANYERELDDMLGFEVEGLPPGHPYPLPEDWPRDQKPLRKDWKPPEPVAR